jgi:hypothetical protein
MSADPLVHGLVETFVDELLAELPALAVEVAAVRRLKDAVVEPAEAARVDRAIFRSQLVHRVAAAAQRALEAELEDIRQEVLTGRRK